MKKRTVGIKSFLLGLTQGGLFGRANMPGGARVFSEDATSIRDSAFYELFRPYLEQIREAQPDAPEVHSENDVWIVTLPGKNGEGFIPINGNAVNIREHVGHNDAALMIERDGKYYLIKTKGVNSNLADLVVQHTQSALHTHG